MDHPRVTKRPAPRHRCEILPDCALTIQPCALAHATPPGGLLFRLWRNSPCYSYPGRQANGGLALLIGQAQAFGILPSEFAAEVVENVPVAILTTEEFDASTVDATTVLFGPDATTPVEYRLEDVDDDGDWILLLHFKTQETGIAYGDTEATLTGHMLDGVAISGADSVKTVGCKKRHHHRHHKHDDRDYDKDDQGKDHDKD